MTRPTNPEPATEAGRAYVRDGMGAMSERLAATLAIEAAARAEALAELRRGVEGLAATRMVPLRVLPSGPQDWDSLVSRAAVLALLADPPKP